MLLTSPQKFVFYFLIAANASLLEYGYIEGSSCCLRIIEAKPNVIFVWNMSNAIRNIVECHISKMKKPESRRTYHIYKSTIDEDAKYLMMKFKDFRGTIFQLRIFKIIILC